MTGYYSAWACHFCPSPYMLPELGPEVGILSECIMCFRATYGGDKYLKNSKDVQ